MKIKKGIIGNIVITILVIILFMFMSASCHSQVGQQSELRFSIGQNTTDIEINYDIKIEAETGTYGDNRHRISIGAEIITELDFYALSIGYGYHIPYKIGRISLSVQPSFNVGVIFTTLEVPLLPRPPSLQSSNNTGKVKGGHHFLALRHHIRIGEHWGVYVKNRLIRRPDVQAQVNYEIPFYQVDNAIGLYFKL